MKYQDGIVGSRSEAEDFLKNVMAGVFKGRHRVEGQPVVIPDGRELDCKVKYSIEEDGASVTFKVSWDNDVYREDEDESDDD